MESPLILPKAQRNVPSLKYVFGIAGITEVVAIIAAGFGNDLRIAVFGTVLMFGAMFILLIFSALVEYNKNRNYKDDLYKIGLFLSWAFSVLLIAIAVLLLTSAFFEFPQPLSKYSTFTSISQEPITIDSLISSLVTSTATALPPATLYCKCYGNSTYCFQDKDVCEHEIESSKCTEKQSDEIMLDKGKWKRYKDVKGWYTEGRLLPEP